MGRVYRAHDTTLGRDVAIKLIESSALQGPGRTLQRQRFAREARAAARIQHPRIAVVHDVDPEAGWLVMELVDGTSLRTAMERGPLAAELVARIAAQVLDALAAAHAAGVIHRDIKPSNIMLGPDGGVKLVDFGIARAMPPTPRSRTPASWSARPRTWRPSRRAAACRPTRAPISTRSARRCTGC